jgi:glutamyl-tRNA reductase
MSRVPLAAIVAIVSHAREVPAVERQRLSEAIHRDGGDGLVVLETCHRVEAYSIADLQPWAVLDMPPPPGARTLVGEEAVRHAMNVAVGRDSVVVGEDQVLHQLRVAVEAARSSGRLDPILERLFSIALRAGRTARSWRQGPARSLADVAIDSIQGRLGPVKDRELLVVGAGRMGRLTAQAATDAGAAVAIANRSPDTARAVASSLGARVVDYTPAGLGSFAAIVVALSGRWPIDDGAVEELTRSSTILVDLSVPPAVSANVAAAMGQRLITADQLASPESGSAEPDPAARRLDSLVEQATAEFLTWLARRDGRSAAEALVGRADRERQAELAALWRKVPDLEPETRAAIEGMTRHLADRLLREPLARLGRDADGRDERAVRDLFGL